MGNTQEDSQGKNFTAGSKEGMAHFVAGLNFDGKVHFKKRETLKMSDYQIEKQYNSENVQKFLQRKQAKNLHVFLRKLQGQIRRKDIDSSYSNS